MRIFCTKKCLCEGPSAEIEMIWMIGTMKATESDVLYQLFIFDRRNC